MITYERFELDNGLKVLVHEDKSTPLVAMNILYKVGARDEEEERTGFAHLFEHLMFGGSVNIPDFDQPLQRAGGENNAFTNNDITNYYLTIPAENLETAFWLESDRMLNLAFSEKSLDVQRNVVVEEFKQRYLNQPYGNVWLKLRPLAYKVHPYKWATIGKEIRHIEEAKLEDVRNFFNKWYAPDNAILTLAGNCSISRVKELCEKWFAPIAKRNVPLRKLPEEPEQTAQRRLSIKARVPSNNIYIAWHCCSRRDDDFYATDLISDILSRGKSSRMYLSLVKEKKLFTDISAYTLGDLDKSLFVTEGKLVNGVSMEQAENTIFEELEKIKAQGVNAEELNKVINKVEATLVFSEMKISNKSFNLAYYEMLGNADDVNNQISFYRKVTPEDIRNVAGKIFRTSNSNIIHYCIEQ